MIIDFVTISLWFIAIVAISVAYFGKIKAQRLQKEAEDRLEENERWYRNILTTVKDGIVLYGEDGQVIVFNDSLYELFGMKKGELSTELFDKHKYDLFKEDSSIYSREELPLAITLKTGQSKFGEVIGIKKNGKMTWISVNTKILNPCEQEGVRQVVITMTDITDKKQQETKLIESNALRRTIIDNLPIGVIVVDNDMKIVAINRPLCRIFNIQEPFQQLIGKNVLDYSEFFFNDLKGMEKLVDRICHKKPFETEFERNQNLILKMNYVPFAIDEKIIGHLLTFEDLTERKKMEKRIIASKDEAEKANLAKSDFLSKMSHELRTPLNGILGFSQLLELEDTLTEEQQLFVKEIIKGGRHLLSLINETLDLSRIETGKLKISYQTIGINQIINECLNLMVQPFAAKGIQFTNKLDKRNELFIYSDPIRFKQIILNLLENAVRYNQQNGEIMIDVELKDEYVIIHVTDNGIGISKNDQELIFEPFYRAKNSNAEGTGIGLSLVKQLVILMGGKLGVESSVGEGSDFWVGFPVITIEKDYSTDYIISEKVFVPEMKQKKILYIDDNPSNLLLVSQIFKTVQEITLLSALTGKEGVDIALTQSIDLILLDMNLSDSNGFEVMRQLQSSPITKDIPVIALSANAMPSEINHALEKGFKDYIVKPIEISSFLKDIIVHLT
ncbi:PAS domain-containing hybrid sensor histidine kinase/response regulator [Pseudoneobacillus sp. C159]